MELWFLMTTTSKLVQRMRKGLLERLKLKLRSKEGRGIRHEDVRWKERKVGGCVVWFRARKSICKGPNPETNLDLHISGVV